VICVGISRERVLPFTYEEKALSHSISVSLPVQVHAQFHGYAMHAMSISHELLPACLCLTDSDSGGCAMAGWEALEVQYVIITCNASNAKKD